MVSKGRLKRTYINWNGGACPENSPGLTGSLDPNRPVDVRIFEHGMFIEYPVVSIPESIDAVQTTQNVEKKSPGTSRKLRTRGNRWTTRKRRKAGKAIKMLSGVRLIKNV
jgi:hypothetical protein